MGLYLPVEGHSSAVIGFSIITYPKSDAFLAQLPGITKMTRRRVLFFQTRQNYSYLFFFSDGESIAEKFTALFFKKTFFGGCFKGFIRVFQNLKMLPSKQLSNSSCSFSRADFNRFISSIRQSLFLREEAPSLSRERSHQSQS